MIIEAVLASTLVGGLFSQVNSSMEIDEKAMKKNIKAFTKMAESENKLKRCQQNVVDKLIICAKRKKGILSAHVKMFEEQFEMIRKVEFKSGQGIEEIEKIDELKKKIDQSISVEGINYNTSLRTPQTLVAFALFGIGGLMIKESEMSLKAASKTVAQSNAVAAQVDSICIALDGLAIHVEIVIDLLQRLGVFYMMSIKNMKEIINKNGLVSDKYSKSDIDSINLSFALTKVIYRIINTPLVDVNGTIEQESLRVVEEGNRLLKNIQG